MGNKRSKKSNKIKKNVEKLIISLIVIVVLTILEYFMGYLSKLYNKIFGIEEPPVISYNIGEIPEYKDSPYAVINDNKPNFDEKDYNREFEEYSDLDLLGRCGVAYANISRKTMPQNVYVIVSCRYYFDL